MTLWAQEPTENDLAAAERGALVPVVAVWKSRTGRDLNAMEQAFTLGYAYGADDRLALNEAIASLSAEFNQELREDLDAIASGVLPLLP